MDESKKNKLKPVAMGVRKKRSNGSILKLADIFISDDIANVKTYVFMDVIVPTIKETMSNVVDMILFGRGGRRSKSSSNSTRYSYNSYYEKEKRPERDRGYSPARRTMIRDYNDINLDSRGAAESVLDEMNRTIDDYRIVTVADFYDLVGITGDYTDNDYGWTDISTATINRDRGGGYIIKFPKAYPIK